MHIITHKMSNRALNSRFQHAAATTRKIFHEVLNAIMIFPKDMIVDQKFNQPHGEITHHKTLREGHLKEVIGSIDGILISTNVMA
ncbi:hypothetical protein GIB67_013775 [Kingdonia uniflora]|uniref:DUF8040 domain-containing protein n=1 Tax=Kingdonia uniflora TaxID=39325 RepID=A0A7J7MN82_9MAGN|nr:hypothetical protein GIB67_013775 [Kingdonia uniflora]